MPPVHVKSENEKPFIEGRLFFHTDATCRETLEYLGFVYPACKLFGLVFYGKLFDKKNKNCLFSLWLGVHLKDSLSAILPHRWKVSKLMKQIAIASVSNLIYLM